MSYNIDWNHQGKKKSFKCKNDMGNIWASSHSIFESSTEVQVYSRGQGKSE